MWLFIPSLGTRLVLQGDWRFILHREYRNNAVMQVLAKPTIELATVSTSKLAFERGECSAYYRNPRVVKEWEREVAPPFYSAIPGLTSKQAMVDLEYERDVYPETFDAMLPSGTVLIVDRIYIRKGSEDYNSVTFRIEDCPDKRLAPKKAKGFMKGQARFWVKLADANRIQCRTAAEREAA